MLYNRIKSLNTTRLILFLSLFLVVIFGAFVFWNDYYASSLKRAAYVTESLDFDKIKKIAYEDNNIDSAIYLANEYLHKHPEAKRVHHLLARLYLVKGNFKEAKKHIEQYIKLNPNDKRAFYLLALVQAGSGDLKSAESAMKKFILSGKSSWQGYLDLSWIQYQQGKYDEALNNVNYAIDKFGQNPWLLINKGAILIALNKKKEAKIALENAEKLLKNTPKSSFIENYRLSPDKTINDTIKQFYSIIELNKRIAQGEKIEPTLVSASLATKIASPSSDGVTKGVAVSACGDTCTTVACISPVCGFSGTRSSCGGTCSAQDPANVGNSCTITDKCGNERSGTITCSGSCAVTQYSISCGGDGTPVPKSGGTPDGPADMVTTIVVPPTLNPTPGTGGSTQPSAASAVLVAQPNITRQGNKVKLAVFATNTQTCSIQGDNGFSSGTLYSIDDETEVYVADSNALNAETNFVATCQTIYGNTIQSNSVKVKIVPLWNEL